MTGGATVERPAPADVIGGICMWFAEAFPALVEDAGITVDDRTGYLTIESEYRLHLRDDALYVRSYKLYYEDPKFFDQLRVVVQTLLESGFDGLDCLFSLVSSFQQTQGKPEDNSGSEGRIKVSAPAHQPASLIFYLRYRYASTKGQKQ